MTQDRALDILKTGANVFLTGEPGSGKTYTVNAYVAYLRENGVDPAITASTGIAATHLSGMTIHSWSGIGVKSHLSPHELEQLTEKEKLVKRLNSAKVLIIDEISMLSAATLDTVELVCRTLRRRAEPFGGLQVIFVGDFFQLPPIDRTMNAPAPMPSIETGDLFYEAQGDPDAPHSNFAYGAQAWKRAAPLVCYLSEQHRQEDEAFLSILTTLRSGEGVEDIRDALMARAVEPEDKSLPKLFPKNLNVDSINTTEPKKIAGAERVFEMTSVGYGPIVEGLKKNCLSPERLALKVGAKIMFTKNHMEGKYVNGTLGEVLSFSSTSGLPIVKTRDGMTFEVATTEWSIMDGQKLIASLEQLPLRLAWAITIHKSQGMSLDAAVIDLGSAFEYGQGYVALSRVRSLSGVYLLGLNDRALRVHPEVQEKDGEFRKVSDEAEIAFESLEEGEAVTMQEAFITAIGGEKGKKVEKKGSEISTYEQTKRLILEGKSIEEVASARGVTAGTVLSHLEKLKDERLIDPAVDLEHIKPEPARFVAMEEAFLSVRKKDKMMNLTAARRITGDDYSFDELRLARLFVV